jgi:telomere length regulation protein
VGHYISHLDKSVRLCGLLVAEMIAEKSGKQLAFGVWEGNENAQLWAKSTRRLVCDVKRSPPDFPTPSHADPELSQPIVTESQNEDLVDSDDSATGYLSDASSDAATQLPEDLDAMENDASLRNGAKIKVYRPVYLRQLLEYLRPSASMDAEVAEKQEIGLKVCEDLIRRKRDYGTELSKMPHFRQSLNITPSSGKCRRACESFAPSAK